MYRSYSKLEGTYCRAKMPTFEDGAYLIRNCFHRNNAALLNDDSNEPVRGILPGPVKVGKAREYETVTYIIHFGEYTGLDAAL